MANGHPFEGAGIYMYIYIYMYNNRHNHCYTLYCNNNNIIMLRKTRIQCHNLTGQRSISLFQQQPHGFSILFQSFWLCFFRSQPSGQGTLQVMCQGDEMMISPSPGPPEDVLQGIHAIQASENGSSCREKRGNKKVKQTTYGGKL